MTIIKVNNQESTNFGEDIREFQGSLIGYAETEGRHNAQQNKPTTFEELKAFIYNHIWIKTDEQIHKNEQQYLPVAGMVVANKIKIEADQKCRELSGALNDAEHRMCDVEKKKKELAPDLKQQRKRKLSHLVVALIGLSEGYLISETLRRSGFPALAAFVTSIGLAVGISFLTHIAAEWIRQSITKKQLVLRICLVLIPAAILFFALGTIRAEAYNTVALLRHQIGTSGLRDSANSSGWKIAVVSFFLYCIGLAISVRYAKTKAEKEQEKAYEKLCREYKELQREIAECKTAIETIQNKTAQQVQSALATYEFALARERQLQSIAQKALEAYASTNLRHRTDGICPAFFSTLPTFTFATFFDKTKAQNQTT